MRLRLAALLGVLALAGCGGDDLRTGSSAASVAPANALGFVEVSVDLESEQWERVQELLNKFPSRPQLVEKLNEELREEGLTYEDDVEPAFGDTVAFVWPAAAKDGEDVVVLTQPDDDAKFEALVDEIGKEENEEYVTGEVDGWRAAAESQAALDALKNGEGSLADEDAFTTALGELPDERLGFGWVRGEAAKRFGGAYARGFDAQWAAAAVEAREDGPAATFVVRSNGASGGEPYESERVAQAPRDALAFLSFEAKSLREGTSALAPLTQMLGVDLERTLAELQGEGALWVRPALGFPEVTLVVSSSDAAAARRALEPLFANLPLDVKFGVVDGQLVVTTASSPEEALRTPGGTLESSADFREAVEVAGMPDETSGFLFVNVADALPLLGLAAGAGAGVPDELVENLRPVRSVVAWSEADGPQSTQTLFVHIQ